MRGCHDSRHAHCPRLLHSYGRLLPRQPCRPRRVPASSGPMVAQRPRKAIRKGIENELPPREPTVEEIEWLATWILRRATAFVDNHGAGSKTPCEVRYFLASLL